MCVLGEESLEPGVVLAHDLGAHIQHFWVVLGHVQPQLLAGRKAPRARTPGLLAHPAIGQVRLPGQLAAAGLSLSLLPQQVSSQVCLEVGLVDKAPGAVLTFVQPSAHCGLASLVWNHGG